MDEKMEVEEVVFEAYEVDIEYEYDAAMCFDFSREESDAEARDAELWFESAKSYPPSPFVAKLFLREDAVLETVNTSPKSKDMDNVCGLVDGDHGVVLGLCLVNANNKGSTFCNHLSSGIPKVKPVFTAKSFAPRSSTLMNPTASQLAKQNWPPQLDSARFQKPPVRKTERSLCTTSGAESHVIKKQKLDGGHSRKVTEAAPQTNFVHKTLQKDVTVDKNASHAKLRLTVPREPDLETSQRAQRIRPKNSKELEHGTTAIRRFKARPLNKKILEAPSFPLPKKSTPKLPEFHEFHLRTLERAMQNTSASTSSHCSNLDMALDKSSTSHVADLGNREFSRSNTIVPKHNRSDITHTFIARPLDKKILASKVEIGLFSNSEREATIPMDFNLPEKRMQQPPTDLFSKLSLTSELQPNNASKMKLPQPTFIPMKGSKENSLASFQPEHKFMKENPALFGGKQIHGEVMDASQKLAANSARGA